MLLICIFCMLQVTYSVLIDDELYDKSLVNTLNQFFHNSPKIDNILVGKISMNQKKVELQAYLKGVTQLNSNKAYLIITQSAQSDCILYYWVGTNTPLDLKKLAAKSAVQLYTSLQEFFSQFKRPKYLYISRERENIESASFLLAVNSNNSILKGVNQMQANASYEKYINTEFPSDLPNLYVVRGGEETTRIKKVSVETKWLKNDTCLMLESGYSVEELTPLSIYCGINSSLKARNRVQSCIPNFRRYYRNPRGGPIHQNLNRNDQRFKMFIEMMENRDFAKPYEVDISNEHLTDAEKFVENRDKNVKFFIVSCAVAELNTPVSTSVKNVEKREMEERPMFSSNFTSESNNYFADTASVAGIYVMFGKHTQMTEKLKTIEYAEEYLDHVESITSIPQRMRIMTFTTLISGFSMFDFKINMIDFPVDVNMVRQTEHW